MRFLFRLLFFFALIIWIVYSKDVLLPYFNEYFGDFIGYIITGLLVFCGGWVIWRITSKGRLF